MGAIARYPNPISQRVRFEKEYAVSESETIDDCAAIEITLRPTVYAELLVRLDRFAARQDNQADRNWLQQFVMDMRMKHARELH